MNINIKAIVPVVIGVAAGAITALVVKNKKNNDVEDDDFTEDDFDFIKDDFMDDEPIDFPNFDEYEKVQPKYYDTSQIKDMCMYKAGLKNVICYVKSDVRYDCIPIRLWDERMVIIRDVDGDKPKVECVTEYYNDEQTLYEVDWDCLEIDASSIVTEHDAYLIGHRAVCSYLTDSSENEESRIIREFFRKKRGWSDLER